MIIDGRTIANHILADLLLRVDALREKYGLEPHLAVIRVGDDPAITSYINQKAKMAKEIGAELSVYNFPIDVQQDELKKCIIFLQEKTNIHGLILQLPVPKRIDYEALLKDIHPDKDVDGFRPNSQFTIPIASAVLKLLEIPMIQEQKEANSVIPDLPRPVVAFGEVGIGGKQSQSSVIPGLTRNPEKEIPDQVRDDNIVGVSFLDWLRSKKIVVMGKGKTGGQPIIRLLQTMNIQPVTVDSNTPHPSQITLRADIIITAVGKPNILTSDMIQKDSILIGVGMSMDESGKWVGDYDENTIKDKASWYTPIPGGVGPVNVACLMENLVLAAENSIKN